MRATVTERNRYFRGDRLKHLREQRDLTQDELSEMLGIGYAQMNRYENGKTEPGPEAIVKIASALEVTTDYLLGLVDNPTDRLQEQNLSPEERKLLSAFRRGDLRKLMRIVIDQPAAEK